MRRQEEEEEEEEEEDDEQSSSNTPTSNGGGRSRGSGRLFPSPLKKSPLLPVVNVRLDPLKPHASIQNSARAARRYERRLKRGPDTRDDGPGFLFARRFLGDPGGDLYCELGISADCSNSFDGEPLFMAFPEVVWWPVQRRRFCKALVFLLLDAMRVYRYETRKHDHTGHDMCVSVYKNSRAPVKDNVWRFYDMSVSESVPILATRPVHKNWFVVSASVAEEIIATVTAAINGHWKN